MRVVGLMFGALCLALVCPVCLGQEEPAPGKKHVFRLEPIHAEFSHPATLRSRDVDVAYRKEPEYAGKKVLKCVFRENPDSKAFVSVAWDVKGDVAYVDGNANLDLTDDGRALSNDRDGPTYFRQTTRITLPVGGLDIPYSLMLNLINRSSLYGYARVNSGWAGKVELNGREWEMAVVDDVNGSIGKNDAMILRPLSEKGTTFGQYQNLYHHFPAARRLVFDGCTYEVDYAFEAGEKAPCLVVTFTESPAGEGTVAIKGESILRVVLSDDTEPEKPCVVVLDHPEGEVKMPCGTYKNATVLVGVDPTAFVLHGRAFPNLTVLPGVPAALKLGGPLTHTVEARKRWGSLLIYDELLGIGGERYFPARSDAEEPRFTVKRDGEPVFQGALRYG